MSYDPTKNFPFLRKELPRTDKYKHKLLITLFGSYRTPAAHARLKNFRDYLQNHGYKNAKLVEDWDIPDKPLNISDEEYFDLKSTYWLNNSDVLFFLFYLKTDNSGVSSEFTEHCDNCVDKLWRTVVCIEVKKFEEREPVSTRISGRLWRHGSTLKRIHFLRNKDTTLHERSFGLLSSFMNQLIKELMKR